MNTQQRYDLWAETPFNTEKTGCFSDSGKFFHRDKSCCVKNADGVRWAAAATGEEMTSETVDYCLSEWFLRDGRQEIKRFPE